MVTLETRQAPGSFNRKVVHITLEGESHVMSRQSPEQIKANELIAARTDLPPKLKAQYLIENFIQPSWLGPETDGNVKANFAKQIVDALDGAGILRQ